MGLVWRLCCVVAMLCVCGTLEAATLVKRIAPFRGTFFEGFESITNYPATNFMGGLCAGGGAALSIQNGNYFNLWDQHAFEGDYFLGASAGMGVLATVEFTFAVPVKKFGGYFGHRVRPGVESAGDITFVFYDARDREIGRDQLATDSLPGGVAGFWQFGRDVKRVTFTYFNPMADAVTAEVKPILARKFTRASRPAPSR